MGADFCYTYTTVKGSREEALETAEKISVKHLDAILVDTGYDYLVDEFGDEGDEFHEQAVREVFRTTINEVWDAIEHRSREAAVLEINGEKVLLTGGLSWGDSPTDIYDTINLYDDFMRMAPEKLSATT